MTAFTRPFRRLLLERRTTDRSAPPRAEAASSGLPEPAPIGIAPDDALLAHLEGVSSVVELDALELDSPALHELRAAGVKLVVPLLVQGELIGVLNLGSRLSEQHYSSDDRRLLENLAAQAAPALRVGQLVLEQQAEAVTRQRFESELEVARLVQQNFLPRKLPVLEGWRITAHYQPAREVGGDFYDVIELPDGRVAFVIGDVTDKGVPAALVMSATRSILRANAQRLVEPGEVLRQVNEHLCPDMPAKMFVTCLYAVLDPVSGRLTFANAGHDLPKLRRAGQIAELRARGMPLGLMPGMDYEEAEAALAPGDSVMLHSDGIIEAHDDQREMFGAERLEDELTAGTGGRDLIDRVLAAVRAFTGPELEQEDDITIVTLECMPEHRVLDEFALASTPGNEREAIDRVASALAGAGLTAARLDALKTAVGEAVMNAMEHGNRYRLDEPVMVRVLGAADAVRVQIVDCGDVQEQAPPETPDLGAKLEGRQAPRGWGLFLIEKLVDEAHVSREAGRRCLELVMRAGDGEDGSMDADG